MTCITNSTGFLKVLVTILLFAGCMTTVPVQAGWRPIIRLVPEYPQKFDHRSNDAREVSANEAELQRQGYVKLGELSIGQILKDCYRKECKDKEKCKELDYQKSTADEVKRIAAKNGADVVVFSKKDTSGSYSGFGRGRCKRRVDNQGTRAGMVWDEERGLYINNNCVHFYFGDIKQQYRMSVATLWRKDKKLRQRVDREQAFHDAIVRGDFDTVKKFLQQGMPLNRPSLHGRIALNLAALNGHDVLVKFFLVNGADINTSFPYRRPWPFYVQYTEEHMMLFKAKPIHMAAHRGSTRTLGLLLDRGADVTDKNRWGMSALHFASMNPNRAMLPIILKKSGKRGLNSKDALIGNTPLMYAVGYGRIDNVRALIRAGADVNARRGRLAGLLRVSGVATPTALDLAIKLKTRGNKNFLGEAVDYDAIIRVLKKAGARKAPAPKRRYKDRKRRSC